MDWISVRSLPSTEAGRATADAFWSRFSKGRFEKAAGLCRQPIGWFGSSFGEAQWVATMQAHHTDTSVKAQFVGQLERSQVSHLHPDAVLYCFGGLVQPSEVIICSRIEKAGSVMVAMAIVEPGRERIVRFVDGERFRRAFA